MGEKCTYDHKKVPGLCRCPSCNEKMSADHTDYDEDDANANWRDRQDWKNKEGKYSDFK